MEINKEILEEHIRNRYIFRNKHPEKQLFIYNYTQATQYEAYWNDYTKMCRGLIMNDLDEVVARPFKKFFNLSEHQPNEIPNETFEVYEKMDGSLGILYFDDIEGVIQPFMASRGSFNSEQSIKANEMLKEKYQHTYTKLDKNITYLFEIIYPENRIVVDYNTTEDLILLSAFEKTGKERCNIRDLFTSLNLSVVKEYDQQDVDLLKSEDAVNKEGYVIVFGNGERLKIKFQNYVKLHRLVANLTVKNAFDWFKSGKKLSEIVELIPDEYHSWYSEINGKFNEEYRRILESAIGDYNTFYNKERKIFAKNAKLSEYSSILFKIYDLEMGCGVDIDIYKYLKDIWENGIIYDTISTTILSVMQKSAFLENLKSSDLLLRCENNNKYSDILKLYKNSDELILAESLSTSKKPPCYIFDIDGTLALINGRNPYDTSRVLEDTINKPVLQILNIIKNFGIVIVILTGRPDSCEQKTTLWLERNRVEYSDILFRPTGNSEPDYIIKERMWRYINETYNILGIFDDRNQVVNHSRKLGITTFQVAEGNF